MLIATVLAEPKMKMKMVVLKMFIVFHVVEIVYILFLNKK